MTHSAARLGLLCQKNFARARTALANKTNNRQLSILLVSWGCCLVAPLHITVRTSYDGEIETTSWIGHAELKIRIMDHRGNYNITHHRDSHLPVHSPPQLSHLVVRALKRIR